MWLAKLGRKNPTAKAFIIEVIFCRIKTDLSLDGWTLKSSHAGVCSINNNSGSKNYSVQYSTLTRTLTTNLSLPLLPKHRCKSRGGRVGYSPPGILEDRKK